MMNEQGSSQEALLFQAALGIQSPWMITNITLNQETHELHIYLDFEKGSQFPCPICNSICSCYDTQEKIWQHLSFLNTQRFCMPVLPEYLVKRWYPPNPGSLGKKRQWIHSLNGDILILLCKEATVKGVQRITKVSDKRIWTILRHYVEKVHSKTSIVLPLQK